MKLSTIIILVFFGGYVVFKVPTVNEVFQKVTDTTIEKRDNVVNEYTRVKGKVEEVTDTAKRVKSTVDNAINTFDQAVDSVNTAVDSVNTAVNSVNSAVDGVEEAVAKTPEEIREGQKNFADPGPTGMSEAHLTMDIKPWIEWGVSPQDTSTKEERIAALAATEKGRMMLEALGYEY